MFKVLRVDTRSAESLEWLGTKRKFWLTGESGTRILFKAEERGTGEDWAEKLASEFCERLGVPHVTYELADEYNGDVYIQPGVICPDCAPRPLELVHGNQLLFAVDERYPGGGERKYKVREYTVEAVVSVVQMLAPPSESWTHGEIQFHGGALDYFAGYIMLDAWIANQDRHHQNWGAICDPSTGSLTLAPTFDHGASLARNISDEERRERLDSRDAGRRIPHFAQRARSAFYETPEESRTLGTLEAFRRFAERAPKGAQFWLERLRGVTSDGIEAIIDEVPSRRMSPVAKRFTLDLLNENRDRLLSFLSPK